MAVAGLLLVIVAGFVFNTILAGVDLSGITGGTVPRFSGSESVVLATGILGATLMPHVIYLHSSLTSTRSRHIEAGRHAGDHLSMIKSVRRDVLLSLGLAGLANAAMLVIAARLFHPAGQSADTLSDVHSGLGSMLGTGAALAFAIALLASGFASSSVGTYAGQIIMAGFLNRSLPLALRRGITLAPALVVLFMGGSIPRTPWCGPRSCCLSVSPSHSCH